MEIDSHKMNKLEEYCQTKIVKALEQLTGLYCFQIYIPIDNDCSELKNDSKWLHRILIKQIVGNEEIQIIMCISKVFPYDFPKIYLHSSHRVFMKKFLILMMI